MGRGKTTFSLADTRKMFPSQISIDDRTLIRAGAISGCLAVGLGAYGAHDLQKNLKDQPKEKAEMLYEMFHTASKYHFTNSIMMIADIVFSSSPPLSNKSFHTGSRSNFKT